MWEKYYIEIIFTLTDFRLFFQKKDGSLCMI